MEPASNVFVPPAVVIRTVVSVSLNDFVPEVKRMLGTPVENIPFPDQIFSVIKFKTILP